MTSSPASVINHEKINHRICTLSENMTDLIMALSQETSGLAKILDITEPLNRDEVNCLMERSLRSFCNFYVTSVAPEVSPDEILILTSQLSRSDEEMEDLSQ